MFKNDFYIDDQIKTKQNDFNYITYSQIQEVFESIKNIKEHKCPEEEEKIVNLIIKLIQQQDIDLVKLFSQDKNKVEVFLDKAIKYLENYLEHKGTEELNKRTCNSVLAYNLNNIDDNMLQQVYKLPISSLFF